VNEKFELQLCLHGCSSEWRFSLPVIAPATKKETEEEAEERRRNYEQQRKEYEQEQVRRAEESRLEEERREKRTCHNFQSLRRRAAR
jgi:hypothetical protein